MRKVGIGIIGCGDISTAYLKAAQRFPSHRDQGASPTCAAKPRERRGAEFGVPAMRVDQLLKRDDVEIVINLTVPLAHTDVSLAVLNAGKHVHSEKPLGINVAEARKVMDLAAREESPRRLRAGHVPRRRPPDRAQADRRWRDRHAGRRQRLLHVPRPRALAPGARLLLSARRRADAGHGALLHHRSRAAARPGRERHGLDRARRSPSGWSPASR